MNERMKAVVQGEDICVLATTADGVPHCSLMAYITDASCTNLCMVTHRSTQKYLNLLANPEVCVLVDSRRVDGDRGRGSIKALSVKGTATLIEDASDRARVVREFISAHRHLADFARHPEAVFFMVHIKTLQLLDGATEATYETLI